MDSTFDIDAHLNNLGTDLVENFARAGRATTPGLVGSARETEVRRQLAALLPRIMTVSTGCVIDSFGGTSTQTDVIVHERDNCPVFSINGAEDVGYIPCESVAAVGEVKSTLGKKEIFDATRKIRSVKELRRASNDPSYPWAYRKYSDPSFHFGSPDTALDPINKELDLPLGFIVCERFGVSLQTMVSHFQEAVAEAPPHLAPGIIISLAEGILTFRHSARNSLLWNARGADGMAFFRPDFGSFRFLIGKISRWCIEGRTSAVSPHSHYFLNMKADTHLIAEAIPFTIVPSS
ncbi:DUF6602 domain-containing protein [Herbaspirillum huttiense]|uniref:DUF6602 domain-containing protein n=2 Tax=Herbaspirillum huttiense TaxID=863372 RepID=A0AAJ2H8Q2_9BURK|nr:DUF6602 domain-containing protein [Herbaspirillum huttiense]MDR9834868.1 hypothetical protein [Herbaspirillum huttiense]